MKPEQREPQDIIDGWLAVLRQNRHVTGPPVFAGGLALVGWVASWGSWEWWAFVGVWVFALWLGACSVAELPVRKAVPAPGEGSPWWLRWWRFGSRHLERLYGAAAWVSAGAWSMAVACLGWSGETWRPLAGVGAVLLAPLWAAWFHHRRIRVAVTVERDVAAWGDGSRVGLVGTTARAVAAGAGWFKIKVKAGRGEDGRLHTVDEYRNAVARIAALFGVRKRDITLTETRDESEVYYTVRTEEREVLKAALDLEPDSIVGRKVVAFTDDGEPIEIVYVLDGKDGTGAGGQHGLSVGVTGAGKSSLSNQDCKWGAKAKDCLLIIWDFSPGAAELRAWAPCASWFCATPQEAMRSWEWVQRYAEHRGRSMRGRFHRPSKRKPAILIVCDELASAWAPDLVAQNQGGSATDAANAFQLVKKWVESWTRGLRLFRKYAFVVKGYTQYGVDAAVGGETAKQQLSISRQVFRATRDVDVSQIMSIGKGRTADFPANQPGRALFLGPTIEGSGGVVGRVEYLDDETIAVMVDAWKDSQPLPEPAMRDDLWRGRCTEPPPKDEDDLSDATDDEADDDESGESGSESEGESGAETGGETSAEAGGESEPRDAVESGETPRPAPRRRMATTEAGLTAMYGTLATQKDWVAPSTLASVLGVSTRHAGRVCSQLVDEGRAERKGRGPGTRYRAVPPEQWPAGGRVDRETAGVGA